MIGGIYSGYKLYVEPMPGGGARINYRLSF